MGIEHSDKDNKLNLSLQALGDVYFGSGKIVDNNGGDQGNRAMLFILASIGILILAVACINYLNLSSAQALTQTKALAVRKVCGAPRNTLVRQMILESVLVSLIALPFALLAGHLSLPYISQLLGKSYSLSITSQFLASIAILVAIARWHWRFIRISGSNQNNFVQARRNTERQTLRCRQQAHATKSHGGFSGIGFSWC